jgi:subfamily B ATP-binding cassette protein MsbA
MKSIVNLARWVFGRVGLLRPFRPLVRMYPWGLPAIAALGVLSSLAEGIGISLFIPFFQSLRAGGTASTGNPIIDAMSRLFPGPSEERLAAILFTILLAVVLSSFLAYLNRLLFHWLEARVAHQLRMRLFTQYLYVSYGFHEESDPGDIIGSLTEETSRTSAALSMLVSLIVAGCTLGVYTALLFLISWQLTILVAAAMLVISTIVRLLTRHAKAIGRSETEANSRLVERMIEGVEGMQLIRAFGRESYELERFRSASYAVSQLHLRIAKLRAGVYPIYEILAGTLLVLVLFRVVLAPQSLPAVLVFLLVLYRMQPKVQTWDSARISLDGLLGAVEKVAALLYVGDKRFIMPGKMPFESVREAIVFENVSLLYSHQQTPALSSVSFRIPARRMTALVGPSGAGKSTVVKLLLRLYDPTSGTIRVDASPLQQLDLTAWRRSIALVSQDVYIFNTTIRENIAYGRLEATEEAIMDAAMRADAHEFITQLPEGYDTRVGDRGIRLSGGQRQRISLARALVRDPALLVLDEATNAVDSISEQTIRQALETLRGDCTIIVIAHRSSTVERADRVVVLDEGRLIEEGDFATLLARQGLFSRLYALQRPATIA